MRHILKIDSSVTGRVKGKANKNTAMDGIREMCCKTRAQICERIASCGFTQTMSDLFVLVLMDHHWLQHVQGEGLPTMSLHFYKETADILEVANTC